MSRQAWRDACNTGPATTDWRVKCNHTRLEGRTDDPEALYYDEANDIFLNGLRCARMGDLEAGRAQIASAYLLDSRSINFCVFLPDDPEASSVMLDGMLTFQLMQSDEYSMANNVLRIMLASHMGNLDQEGQGMIREAMNSIEYLFNCIRERPEIEKPAEEGGVLGGCLTRPTLYHRRSALYMALGNRKNALKDLSAALKIDPSFTKARDSRASIWAGANLKDSATIHGEYKQIINEVHPDHRANEVSYAWLAMTTLDDPNLGTFEDAKRYYEKSIRATARTEQLYGPRNVADRPEVLKLLQIKFSLYQSNSAGADASLQKGEVNAQKAAQFLAQVFSSETDDKAMKHVCISCNKSARDAGRDLLMKCARCKKVSYCSKECQKKDWKGHKDFCKNNSVPTPTTHSHTPPQTTAPELAAKKPISEISGEARACARMKAELKTFFNDHGQRFSGWWHEMTTVQKRATLRELTNNTIPTVASTGWSAMILDASMFLPEYNLENLLGSCKCSSDDDSASESCGRHFFRDQLLHEFFVRALQPPNVAEDVDLEIIQGLRRACAIPDMFPQSTLLVPPSSISEGPEKYDFHTQVDSHTDPETTDFDANTKYWMVKRDLFALSLLTRIVDEYQEKVRRTLSKQPYTRIIGCRACFQTCENDSAIRCGNCREYWWCCQGCKLADNHGKKCPRPGPCSSVVTFCFTG